MMRRSILVLVALMLLKGSDLYAQCNLPAPVISNIIAGETSISVYWNTNLAVAYYKVRYRISGGSNWTTSNPLPQGSTYYYINELNAATSYDVRIVPYCSNNQQGNYAVATVTTLPPPQCNLPAPLINDIIITENSIRLIWQPDPAAAYYKVYHRQIASVNWQSSPEINAADSSYQISGLFSGTEYLIQLVPYCSNGKKELMFDTICSTLPSASGYTKDSIVIVIYLDDLPHKMMDSTGAPSFIHTPNFDRIASEGINFTRNYAMLPLCAPSRATLITGRSFVTTGVTDNSTQPNFNMMLPTIGGLLRSHGVYTAALGKFHDVIGEHPSDWDYSFESYNLQKENTTMNPVKFQLNGGAPKKAGNDSIITKVLMDSAAAIIQRVDGKLFLLISLRDPHIPTKVPAPFDTLYEHAPVVFGPNTVPFSDLYPSFTYLLPEKNYNTLSAAELALKDQYRAIAYVDDRIGYLLSVLENTGKLNNTTIILTGDHGFLNQEHALYGKRRPYQESLNVPLFIWNNEWFPQKGTRSTVLTCNADLFSTMLELFDLSDPGSDGLSVKSLYNGTAVRKTAYASVPYTTEGGYEAMPSCRSVWDSAYQYTRYGCSNITEEFFDLKNDPYQMNNLITVPSLQSTIQSYRVTLANIAAQLNDTASGTVINCYLIENGTFDFNVKMSIQGYADELNQGFMKPVMTNQLAGSNTDIVDTVTILLHDAGTLAAVDSSKGLLQTNGIVHCTFDNASAVASYYVVVRYKNTLKTWSALPVAMSMGSYDFTANSLSAFPDINNPVPPLSFTSGSYSIYSGDVNQDGQINGEDMNLLEYAAAEQAFGYYKSDLTGDGATDGADFNLLEMVISLGLFAVHP